MSEGWMGRIRRNGRVPQTAATGTGVLLLTLWSTAPAPAMAQATEAPPGRQAAYVNMARACIPEAARFCPDISGTQLRNIAICLRPYRNDLSLRCRSALRATSTAESTPR